LSPGGAAVDSSVAVEWIADREAFGELAEEWEGLLPADARPFDLHCWYASWWDAFGGPLEPTIGVARREGRLVGAIPLAREGRKLRPLANGHSPVFRPLHLDRDAGERLIEAAVERGGAGLRLAALPAQDPCLERFAAAAREHSLKPLPESGAVSPIVDTSGDFEAWRKLSKPRWGAPLERFRRKMGRDHEAEHVTVAEPVDLDAELEDGFRVEASGWKGEAGTAIVSSPDTEAFYRGIARAFADRGELRLSRIVLDGEVAAFDLCLLHRGRLYLLKTGFDERFRKLAPGLVMRLSTIERCFELGLDAHELLGEESEWKLKFATGERAHVGLRLFPRTPAGAARRLYRAKARPALKRAYHRLRERSR
jgi:CelD/BcsL family acetyltransferase involved in cellulose biosynthesis